MPVTEPDSAPVPPGQVPASSFSIQAPYAPGSPDPIFVGGDNDAGGTDSVAGDVAAAMAAAEARYHEYQGDTYGQGSRIGDTVTMPPSPLDPGVGSLGTTDPAGAFYDPPRNY
jgi:hypothetical protein